MAAQGLDLGVNDYLFEPLDQAELQAQLARQIRHKRASDRLRSTLGESLRWAFTDTLTGLFNRRYARQHLERISDNARVAGKGFAVMMLDIDRFKRVNDRHGHGAGDVVLQELAKRLQANLRGIDLVARLGGEEFLIAMPETSVAEAEIASERLRHVIECRPFTLPKTKAAGGRATRLQITVSIGVTMAQPDCTDVETLIAEADKALYASKAEGRNMVTLFHRAA